MGRNRQRKTRRSRQGGSSKVEPALRILRVQVGDKELRNLTAQQRNLLFGCMHAHNEITALSKLLMFSETPTADGNAPDAMRVVQFWCLLQLVAGKLFETWSLVSKQLLSRREDLGVRFSANHSTSEDWLRAYFGYPQPKLSAIKLMRDKTAFHYQGLDFGQSLKHTGENENNIYLARHPANSNYYLGSVVTFRAIFALIAGIGAGAAVKPSNYDELAVQGADIVARDVREADMHMHNWLYAIIEGLLKIARGGSINPDGVIQITGMPDPGQVMLPGFIKIGKLD